MKLEYDKEVDALYIRIEETIVAKTKEVEEGINLDFDVEGKLIGIEILNAKARYKAKDLFSIDTEPLAMMDQQAAKVRAAGLEQECKQRQEALFARMGGIVWICDF